MPCYLLRIQCLPHFEAKSSSLPPAPEHATSITYRPGRRKQAHTARIRGTMASLTEPVFLRSSRDSPRVICLQDHAMFWQEGRRVCNGLRHDGQCQYLHMTKVERP